MTDDEVLSAGSKGRTQLIYAAFGLIIGIPLVIFGTDGNSTLGDAISAVGFVVAIWGGVNAVLGIKNLN